MISVAVDFDGTLVEDKFPEIGDSRYWVVDLVRRLQKAGVRTVLWTCRRDEDKRAYLSEAVKWCEQHGLLFSAVNENLPEVQAKWGGDTRKVMVDYYLDDKSLGFGITKALRKLVYEIEKRGE